MRYAEVELQVLAMLARRTVQANAWEIGMEIRASPEEAARVMLWLERDGLVKRVTGGWTLVVPAGLERLAHLRQMNDEPEWS